MLAAAVTFRSWNFARSSWSTRQHDPYLTTSYMRLSLNWHKWWLTLQKKRGRCSCFRTRSLQPNACIAGGKLFYKTLVKYIKYPAEQKTGESWVMRKILEEQRMADVGEKSTASVVFMLFWAYVCKHLAHLHCSWHANLAPERIWTHIGSVSGCWAIFYATRIFSRRPEQR